MGISCGYSGKSMRAEPSTGCYFDTFCSFHPNVMMIPNDEHILQGSSNPKPRCISTGIRIDGFSHFNSHAWATSILKGQNTLYPDMSQQKGLSRMVPRIPAKKTSTHASYIPRNTGKWIPNVPTNLSRLSRWRKSERVPRRAAWTQPGFFLAVMAGMIGCGAAKAKEQNGDFNRKQDRTSGCGFQNGEIALKSRRTRDGNQPAHDELGPNTVRPGWERNHGNWGVNRFEL